MTLLLITGLLLSRISLMSVTRIYTINRVGGKNCISTSLFLFSFFLSLSLIAGKPLKYGVEGVKMIVDISYCFNWYSACFPYDVRRLIYLLFSWLQTLLLFMISYKMWRGSNKGWERVITIMFKSSLAVALIVCIISALLVRGESIVHSK